MDIREEENVSRWDARIRVVLAILLAAGSFWLVAANPHWWSIALGGVVGVAYLILTSIVRIDPLYAMINYDTNRHPRRIPRTVASRQGRTLRP